VFVEGAASSSYAGIILLAAGLWAAAFVLFLWVYGPMLIKPRTDGKPG